MTEDAQDHRQDYLDLQEEDRQREGLGPDHPGAGSDRGPRGGDPGHPCTGIKVEADLQETRKSKNTVHFMKLLQATF